ncbi:MAG: Crp/Fnr family transcriptional regulator [Streptomyces sp.]|nr:Crp/Fnr family transcriptional regulator [Streptomyces sp.]NUS23301.1 Crp/Fnr family transcriptional regulator [Streptomyces sp.]NUS80405.1 Crp/Fnr family transcriptional regulator [Streptomyces sp.]
MPYCLANNAEALASPAWGAAPPPWAPGRREETHHMNHATADDDAERTWCLAEVDIFCDLNEAEMEAIAAAAPMKTYHAGEILYSPTQPSEVLFILKRGRVRVFRVSADGRALTTAIISPGTIFGEMVLLGQHMYDNYAEALDDTVVCVMSRTDVHKFLLSDARIAARITAILGRRLADLEQRLSDSVFKTVAQRIATTLTTLTSAQPPAGPLRPVGRHPQIALTHEQLAALAGTSRETCTKVLRDYADHGLLRLARGRITVLDPERLKDAAG